MLGKICALASLALIFASAVPIARSEEKAPPARFSTEIAVFSSLPEDSEKHSLALDSFQPEYAWLLPSSFGVFSGHGFWSADWHSWLTRHSAVYAPTSRRFLGIT